MSNTTIIRIAIGLFLLMATSVLLISTFVWPVFIYGSVKVSEISIDGIRIEARFQNGPAVGPNFLGIFIAKPWYNVFGNARLVDLMNLYNYASFKNVGYRLLLASTFNSEQAVDKKYFLINLDENISNALRLEPNSAIILGTSYSADDNRDYDAMSQKVLDEPNVVHVNIEGNLSMQTGTKWEIFVLEADSVYVSFVALNEFNLTVRWKSGKFTEDICLRLPKPSTGLIEFPCQDFGKSN